MLALLLFVSVSSMALEESSEKWPHWPAYHKTPLQEIRPQVWRVEEDVIDGWDWSLPPSVLPASNGLMAIRRCNNLHKDLTSFLEPLNLPMNQTVTLWIRWKELEPVEGVYTFGLLRERIEEAEKMGYHVVLRILCSATIFAPEWLGSYEIPFRTEHKKPNRVIRNYDVASPAFHKRYLRLIHALGASGIPQMDRLQGAFLGYASPSYGDEGIGPHGVNPDEVPHVIERLDAWATAFEGVEHKVFMGGLSEHGLNLGFGIRRGFVEMFLYHIPDESIGQQLDKAGYLWVDESASILRNAVFHGEENEEYEESWATSKTDFRFGPNTDSFVYRYFTSNLRLLQMRCNYVLYNSFSVWPEQMVWVGQSLGRTVENTPDIWCALRESYVRPVGAVKNFERWLYQRDTTGYETVPAVRIDHAIKMWMVDKGKYYDYIARKGQRIGLAIDDRWCGHRPVDVAIKVTYFDEGRGTVRVRVGDQKRSFILTDTGALKTATFFLDDVEFAAKNVEYDIVFEGLKCEPIVSFVRVIRLDME
jgi:hypothetical protein